MEENVKKQLDELVNIIDEKIEKSSNQIKENVDSDLDSVVKGEISSLIEKHKELEERLDKSEVENKKDNFAPRFSSKRDYVSDTLNKSESFKSMKDGLTNNANVEFKADVLISDSVSGASSSRDAVGVDKITGIKQDPAQLTNMLSIIPVGTTSSNVVRYVKESSWTDNAAFTNEGAAPSDSEFDLVAADAVIQKIVSVMTISQEMIQDTAGLESYIVNRIPQKISAKIDDALLEGNGSSPNLQGLAVSGGGTVFAEGDFADSVESATQLDVLYCAMNQLALSNYNANGIVLHPTDFHKIAILKDTTNAYLRGNSITSADGFLRINGIPVYKNVALTAGNFLIGDFNAGSQVWMRENLGVTMAYENNDNFEKNLVSIRGMARMAHSVYLPLAYVRGTFATAQAAIETP